MKAFRRILLVLAAALFNFASAQKLPSQAEVYLYWNGIVEVYGPNVEQEFAATVESSAVVDFLRESQLRSITIVRDKGWESAASRPDLKRYEEVVALLKTLGYAFEVRSATSRAIAVPERRASDLVPRGGSLKIQK